MRVLGIDPGFDRLGLAVVEGDPSKPVLVWSTCIIPPPGTVEARLSVVADEVAIAITNHAPDLISIESLFFSTNKKTALGVAEARGAILSVAGAQSVPVREFGPGQIKLAVTGYGRSDKKAIARMLPLIIAMSPRVRLDDELDAIAVAIAGLSIRAL